MVRPRKKEERKQEEYFGNLVREGVPPPYNVSGTSREDIKKALALVA